jgi:hypothetical protein
VKACALAKRSSSRVTVVRITCFRQRGILIASFDAYSQCRPSFHPSLKSRNQAQFRRRS